jgi:hypothetical protein
MKTQYVESLVVEVDVPYKPLFKASELLLLLLRHDDKPSGYRGAYGGGADDRVEWRGQTSGSCICPQGLANLINEFRVALMPPRRRVWFLLGGVVSSSILRGYSETERLLEEVIDDGLDDDDPFFFCEKACRLLP